MTATTDATIDVTIDVTIAGMTDAMGITTNTVTRTAATAGHRSPAASTTELESPAVTAGSSKLAGLSPNGDGPAASITSCRCG